MGVIYSKGNQSTQYSLGSETAYLRERWNAKANFSSTLSSSTGTNPSTRNSLGLSALRLLPWNNWFYSGIGNFLESSEQGISLQSTLGGGIGRYLKNTNRASIALLGGVAWQETRYQPTLVPLGSQNVASALIAADVRLFKFDKTNLTATASILPLSQPGRVRFDTNVSYYIRMASAQQTDVISFGRRPCERRRIELKFWVRCVPCVRACCCR